MFKKYFKYCFLIIIISIAPHLNAFIEEGIIDSNNHSALLCIDYKCTTQIKIDFLTESESAVRVTDDFITGQAWSKELGWIDFNSNNGNVTNTKDGLLGGYAWGENTGLINFAPTKGGVKIDKDGKFFGWAWAQNVGWIKFDCNIENACVQTNWRQNDIEEKNILNKPSFFSSLVIYYHNIIGYISATIKILGNMYLDLFFLVFNSIKDFFISL